MGSTVGSPGGPIPPPPSLATAKLTITLPREHHVHASRGPAYLSPNTRSVSVGLASVNGGPISGARTTVVNTQANETGCKGEGRQLVCTSTVDAASGDDTFNVTTYAWKNATGAVLSAGTVSVRIGSGGGGGVQLNNKLALSVGGVIAKMSLHVAKTTVSRGQSAVVPVTLTAVDPSGAQIVGASPFLSPVSLSIQGDGSGGHDLRAQCR